MITSAESGEGKSTLAALLALAVAQTGSRVVLVDCDLRLPAQHRLFGLPNDVGLSTLLSGRSSLAETLQYDKATGVTLLPAGPRPSRPAELLASPRMADVIRCLKQQFDTVLVDAPALLAVADASILAHLMEQILLVVLSGQTREEAAHAAQEQLMLVQAQLSGIVLNRVRSSAERYWKHA